jgi:1-acyl-sn-glycerol-3-phosphate acyltransferase
MGTLRRVARGAWSYTLLAIGGLLLALILFIWGLMAMVLNLVLPAAAGRRVGRRGVMACFRIFLGTMEALGALRLDIDELDGLRGAGPLIIAPNHPCLLDAVLVVSRLPDSLCVMKRELLGNFLLGPGSRLARYVRNDSLLRLATRAGRELRLGGQLLIFPEGTRSTADPVGPFTDAVGALSRRTNVPVQTIVIETDSRFLGKGWPAMRRPDMPLAYRVRLGRRFDPPKDVRAFTVELERYFSRELAPHTVPLPVAKSADLEEAHRIRG